MPTYTIKLVSDSAPKVFVGDSLLTGEVVAVSCESSDLVTVSDLTKIRIATTEEINAAKGGKGWALDENDNTSQQKTPQETNADNRLNTYYCEQCFKELYGDKPDASGGYQPLPGPRGQPPKSE